MLDAVRPGVGGKPAAVAYKMTAQTPYVPTPLVVGDLLFVWSDTGTVTCVNAVTGKKQWEQRVSNSTYFASPIAADGKVYNVSKSGEVVCFAAAAEGYKELGRSKLPLGNREVFNATPAIANGRMFFRTFSQLISVGK
jgi:outer membrane protein assembly factor BamB